MKRIQALRMSLWEPTSLPSGVMCRCNVNRPFEATATLTPSIHYRLLDYKYRRGRISLEQLIEQSLLMKPSRAYTRLCA